MYLKKLKKWRHLIRTQKIDKKRTSSLDEIWRKIEANEVEGFCYFSSFFPSALCKLSASLRDHNLPPACNLPLFFVFPLNWSSAVRDLIQGIVNFCGLQSLFATCSFWKKQYRFEIAAGTSPNFQLLRLSCCWISADDNHFDNTVYSGFTFFSFQTLSPFCTSLPNLPPLIFCEFSHPLRSFWPHYHSIVWVFLFFWLPLWSPSLSTLMPFNFFSILSFTRWIFFFFVSDANSFISIIWSTPLSDKLSQLLTPVKPFEGTHSNNDFLLSYFTHVPVHWS